MCLLSTLPGTCSTFSAAKYEYIFVETALVFPIGVLLCRCQSEFVKGQGVKGAIAGKRTYLCVLAIHSKTVPTLPIHCNSDFCYTSLRDCYKMFPAATVKAIIISPQCLVRTSVYAF